MMNIMMMYDNVWCMMYEDDGVWLCIMIMIMNADDDDDAWW